MHQHRLSKMIILVVALIAASISTAHAQTYFGDGTGTSGLGGSCCNWVAVKSSNGQTCPADQLALHPTCTVITLTQYNAYLTSVSSSYPSYHGRINSGVAVTSTGSPSTLNGTYPIDASTISNLQFLYFSAQIAKLNSSQAFGPGGATSVAMKDKNGNSHTFDRDHIISYGTQILGYLSSLTPGNFPSNNQLQIQ